MLKSVGRTILLVEDEALLALNEKLQLENYGYTVILANSGEKAFEVLKYAGGIDLVLMDINLGSGIDGTEAAEIILKSYDIPIVFLSSHTEPEIVEKTEKITSYGYVVKNSSITVLDASIKMAFRLFEAKIKEKEKEAALFLSEEKFRRISENTSDGIVHFSPDGLIDYVSPSYLRQLGYAERDEFGRGYDDISPKIHPDDRDALFSSLYRAIEKKESELTYTYRVMRVDGRYIWREDHASFTYGTDGAYLGAYVSCRDITERKQIENRLVVLAKAIEASPAIIMITDVTGAIEYVNPRFTTVTGYEIEDVVGKNPRILKSGETEEGVYVDLWQSLSAGNDWKGLFRNRKKNGEIYYVSATIAPIKNQDGETTNYIAIKEDLTEKRYMQESLEESNVRFKTLASSSSLLIWETGTDKLCTYVNPTWLSFTGKGIEDELGNGWAEGIHPDDLLRCQGVYEEAFDARKEFSLEFRLRTANGSYGWLLAHGSPKYHNGEFVGYIGSCVDITENKNYERILREGKEKYRLLYENAGVGIAYYSDNGIVISYNQWAAKHIASVPEELAGRSLYDFFPKADADIYVDRIKKAADSDSPAIYEETLPLVYGGASLLSTYARITEVNGKLLGVQVISQDITKVKQTEAALMASKESAEMLLNVAAEIIISEDFDGRILLLNDSGHKILGYEAPELIGKNYLDICLPPEIREEVGEYFQSLKSDNAETIVNHENEVLTKTGERRDIYWHNAVIKDQDGSPVALLSSGEDITERRKMEAELLEIEGRFKNLLQSHPSLAVQGYGIDGKISYWNSASELLFGYSAEEALGRNLLELIIPDELKIELAQGMARMLDSGIAVPASEQKLVRKDGSSIDVFVSHAIVRSARRPAEYFCFDIDISARKNSEKALRASEQKYRSLIECSSDAISCVDERGEYKFANTVFASIFGKSADYFVGKTFWDIFPKENADIRYETIRRVFQTGKPVSGEFALPLPDKNLYFFATTNPVADEAGKVVLALTYAVDISDRREAEHALRDSQTKLRAYFDRSIVSMVLVRVDQGFLDCNEAFCRFLGFGREEILSKKIADITYSEDLEVGMVELREILAGTKPNSTFEKRYVKKDGAIAWGEINICLLDNLQNQAPCFLATIVDITERKKTEGIVAALLSEKDLLLKEVHHRVKNNMNTVSGLLSLQARAVNEPAAAAALRDAESRIQSMSLLYDKLYRTNTFSSLSAGDYLSSLIDEIIGNFPNQRFIRIEKDLRDFSLDAKRLQPLGIIINELLTNIMKYAFDGRQDGRIAVSAAEADGTIRIRIQDNGKGMPASVCFENSTGFGLRLVYALTQQLDGTVRIEREAGTAVVLEFPL